MKKILLLIILSIIIEACSTTPGKKQADLLAPYIPQDGIIRGDIFVYDFTPEFKEIIRKIQRNGKKNFSWYIGYIVSNQADKPLPYDYNLGISLREHYYLLKWRNQKVLTKIGSITATLQKNSKGVYTFKNQQSSFILTKVAINVIKKSVLTPWQLAFYYQHQQPGGQRTPAWKGLLWTNQARDEFLALNKSFKITKENATFNKFIYLFSIGKIDGTAKCIINIAKKETQTNNFEYNYYIVYPLKMK